MRIFLKFAFFTFHFSMKFSDFFQNAKFLRIFFFRIVLLRTISSINLLMILKA